MVLDTFVPFSLEQSSCSCKVMQILVLNSPLDLPLLSSIRFFVATRTIQKITNKTWPRVFFFTVIVMPEGSLFLYSEIA
ncbi:MAG: hypothetical protein J3R72DRAFT_177946 [Linnemannia gamsii]|nr:MAG: hypothetical protein J3R72DRAFT_177946 [Linnemannia gamsii]